MHESGPKEPVFKPLGRVGALAGMAAIGLVIWLVASPAVSVKTPSKHVARMSDLRTLGQCMHRYIEAHQVVPTTSGWLNALDQEFGLSASADDSLQPNMIRVRYFMFAPPILEDGPLLSDIADPVNQPMFYEHPAIWAEQTGIAYWDGSVRWVDDDELERLLSESDARLGFRYRPHEDVTP